MVMPPPISRAIIAAWISATLPAETSPSRLWATSDRLRPVEALQLTELRQDAFHRAGIPGLRSRRSAAGPFHVPAFGGRLFDCVLIQANSGCGEPAEFAVAQPRDRRRRRDSATGNEFAHRDDGSGGGPPVPNIVDLSGVGAPILRLAMVTPPKSVLRSRFERSTPPTSPQSSGAAAPYGAPAVTPTAIARPDWAE